MFAYGRPIGKTFVADGAMVEVIGGIDAFVYFRSVAPEVGITSVSNGLWVSQETEMEAVVECGDQRMRDQEIELEVMQGANLGSVDPASGFTSRLGRVISTFSANDMLGGTASIGMTYPWTSSLGDRQQEETAETEVEVYSLTGQWLANGTGEDFCGDPEDNGSGPGFAISTIN